MKKTSLLVGIIMGFMLLAGQVWATTTFSVTGIFHGTMDVDTVSRQIMGISLILDENPTDLISLAWSQSVQDATTYAEITSTSPIPDGVLAVLFMYLKTASPDLIGYTGANSFQPNFSSGSVQTISVPEPVTTLLSGSVQTISVPEPVTMLLLGCGLIGLAGIGRKKLFKK